MRFISWFSCGSASAVATKLALEQHPRLIIARCIVANEHPDNSRFASDCAKWFGREIVELRSPKYADAWEVWEKERYLNGPYGAKCTTLLKKEVRRDFQERDDIQFFGFDSTEISRAEWFRLNNIEVTAIFPLIEAGYNKDRCFEVVKEAGIELPAMYRLGYHNANCIGCVKGGKGYWNKIRRDFPAIFERMAKLEESIGASCINGKPLRDLLPHEGRHEDLTLPECGLFCGQNLWFRQVG